MNCHSVQHFGREREPIIVIDRFSSQLEQLVAQGRRGRYAPANGYPGIRSPLDPAYLALGEPVLSALLAEHFDLSKRFRAESCSFSIVSVAPEQLTPAQRRPHYDGPYSNLIATVHYTQGADTGGTAFYRHRRTGYETITPDRLLPYAQALRVDDTTFDALPAEYYYGNSERFELIGEIEARPDRLVAYRGRQLHSGVIVAPPDPLRTAATDRLTINTFLVGEV